MNNKQHQDEFMKLYQPVHDRFERFCRARVYGEMEYTDLMNESLLVAFQKFETLQSKEAFFSFLVGISIRVLSNANRKKKAEYSPDLEQLNPVDLNANSERSAEVHLLHRALSQLVVEQREALILFEITGFTIKEIAAMHEASESAIKQRLKRGREKLTEILTFESTQQTKEVNHG